jgi:BirA family biotin operon repressor/biotin-[acetyl-CoA-carboxylase] ligase
VGLPIDVHELRRQLTHPGPYQRVELEQVTDSTNYRLMNLGILDPAGWPPPAILLAEHQIEGRGRQGNDWIAPPASSILMSMLVSTAPPVGPLTLLPLAGALAICEACAPFLAERAVLKWPNDVLVSDAGPQQDGYGTSRKLGGVLAQSDVRAQLAVVGVGVNVTQSTEQLPVPTATSLRLASGQDIDRTLLAAAIAKHFARNYQLFRTAPAALLALASARMDTLGRAVKVTRPDGETVTGQAVRLGDAGELILQTPGGGETTVTAGDVRNLRLT